MSFDWPIVSFGDIFEITSSKRVLQRDWQKDGVPFYRAREIVKLAKDGQVDNELFISEDQFKELGAKYGVPEAGDLMVSAVGTLGACYVVQPDDKFYFKDASVLRFRPRVEVLPRYIQHAFATPQIIDQINKGSGSTVGTLTISRANEMKIPLPPLEEQKRIAGILDQADALRRLRTRALDKLNTLGQAIFHEMFGDVHSNKKGFNRVQLGEVIKVSSGQGLTAKDMKSGEFPVYGGNGINGYHDEGPVPANTIVIGRVGAYCGAVHTTKSQCWVTDNALVVRNILPVNTAYLAAALELAELNQYAGRAAQPLVSGSRIYPVEILFPPIEAQDEFERVQAKSQHHENLISESSGSIDNLFAALQHRAFRGEL